MSINAGQQYHSNQVHYLRKAITFADNGLTVSLGWVPAKAMVLRGGVVVETAFNGNSSNVLDIGFRNAGDGTTADPDEYATDLALGTAGVIVADEMATAADAYLPLGAEITASVVSTAAASAGSGYVWVEYLAFNGDPT